jgi:hypothetical protein
MPADELENPGAEGAEAPAGAAVEHAAAEPAAADPTEDIPFFDARYRWVLLFALRWLRDANDLELDLDDPPQLRMAYELLSELVQEHVRERGLAGKLDPMRVSVIAESRSVRATVEDILRREHPASMKQVDMSRAGWKAIVAGPQVRQMIEKGVHAEDPSLEPAEIERRARVRRMEFARAFGLHARITDVAISTDGGVRVHVAFDEDITFAPEDLKALEINGVPLTGAQLVDVRRNEAGSPRVQAVIAVNVEKGAIASLRSLPMTVTATTRNDVRVQAIKMV